MDYIIPVSNETKKGIKGNVAGLAVPIVALLDIPNVGAARQVKKLTSCFRMDSAYSQKAIALQQLWFCVNGKHRQLHSLLGHRFSLGARGKTISWLS